eukprot:TRINITY_DN30623_c0_g1_i1.p1 TRINITY_DN30623_c0_g1~~TRINITY_DN30623_c0_g1_i1.p1  ORF type:complete len:1176 (+),score=282.42 TRINITY_DN30623_c0_g1_i1:61-3588(+)
MSSHHRYLRLLCADGGMGVNALFRLTAASYRPPGRRVRARESWSSAVEAGHGIAVRSHLAAFRIQEWWWCELERLSEQRRVCKRAEGAAYDLHRSRWRPPESDAAVVCVQSWWRGRQGVGRMRHAQRMNRAAARLQGLWRMFVARREAQDRRDHKRAQSRIAFGIRACLVAKRVRHRRFLRKRVDRHAQKFRALLEGRKTRAWMARRRQAAAVLTRVWRTRRALALAVRRAGRQNDAARKIQRAWRGRRGRAAATRRKRQVGRMHHFATRLQSVWRGCTARWRLRRRTKAARTLQRAWRVHFACWRVIRRRKGHAAALKIQQWWRWSLWQTRAYLRYKAARLLQAVWRGVFCRSRLAAERRCAEGIQRVWRGRSGRNLVNLLRGRLHAAAATIVQAPWRGAVTRIRIARQGRAARKVQRFVRQQLKAQRTRAARAVQRMWRGHYERNLVRSYAERKQERRSVVREEAAALLARWWRGRAARLLVLRMHAAASRVQRTVRGKQARVHVGIRRTTRNHAAALFQGAWWGWRGPRGDRKGGRKEHRRRRAAVIAIQRRYRGHLVRQGRRRKWAAAAAIQTAWRYQRSKVRRRVRYARRSDAARTIQRAWRNYSGARRRSEQLKCQNEAARTIQRHARGRAGRKAAGRRRDRVRQQAAADARLMQKREADSAAAAIQARWRGKAARRWYKDWAAAELGSSCMRVPVRDWYAPATGSVALSVSGDISEQQLSQHGEEELARPNLPALTYPVYRPSSASPPRNRGSPPPAVSPPAPATATSPKPTEQHSLAASLPVVGTESFAASALPARAATPQSTAAAASPPAATLGNYSRQGVVTQWEGMPVPSTTAAWGPPDGAQSPGWAQASLGPASSILTLPVDSPMSLGGELAHSRDTLAATIHQAHWQLMQVNHHLYMHQAERVRLEKAREHRRREQAVFSEKQRGTRELDAAKAAVRRGWGRAVERSALEETVSRGRVSHEEERAWGSIVVADAEYRSRAPLRRRRQLGGLVAPLNAERVRPRRLGWLQELIDPGGKLSVLDLASQRFTDVSAHPLFRALEVNRTLRELTLDHNKLTDHGCAALSAALRKNSSLRRLSLRGNPITDVGAAQLVAALRHQVSTDGRCAAVDLSGTLVSADLRAAAEGLAGEAGEFVTADELVSHLRRDGDARSRAAGHVADTA